MSTPRLIWIGVCLVALVFHLFAVKSGKVNLGDETEFIVKRTEKPELFWTYSVGVVLLLLYLIWLGAAGTISL